VVHFEQIGDELKDQALERAHDRVQHQPRLLREQRETAIP